MSKLECIAHDVARVAHGVLNRHRPHLRLACRSAGLVEADLDLLSEDRSSPVLVTDEALREASARLRRWFENRVASRGLEARSFTEAIVTLKLMPDPDEIPAWRVRCRLRTKDEPTFESVIAEDPAEGSVLRPRQINGAPMPHEASVDELVVLAGVAEPARWAVLRALGQSADPRAVEKLIGFSQSADWTVRRAAVEAIGLRPRAPVAADRLAMALDDEDQRVVRTAIEAVARLGLARLHDRVVALTACNHEATRVAAVAALERLWEPTDLARLLAIARTDASNEVRNTAVHVLRHHADSNSWQQLFDLWIDDPLPRHRTWACQLFEMFGGQTMETRVAAARRDRDGHVRKAAERAIARLRESS